MLNIVTVDYCGGMSSDVDETTLTFKEKPPVEFKAASSRAILARISSIFALICPQLHASVELQLRSALRGRIDPLERIVFAS